MIASIDRINLFLKKHKSRDDRRGLPLWNLAHRKRENVERINRQIISGNWCFGGRTDKILSNGKRVSFYSEWEDRFVEFCLYRHLTELDVARGEVFEDYMSFRGRGRFNCYRGCPIIPTFSKLTSSPIAKASVVPLLESLLHRRGLPPPLHNLILQDLSSPEGGLREKRIFQGSSLSCHYDRLYLEELDRRFCGVEDVHYQRYRDDILLLSRAREALEWCRDAVYGILRKRKLKTRYHKTFGGGTTAPLVWLGFVVHRGGDVGRSRESRRRRDARKSDYKHSQGHDFPAFSLAFLSIENGNQGQMPNFLPFSGRVGSRRYAQNPFYFRDKNRSENGLTFCPESETLVDDESHSTECLLERAQTVSGKCQE